MRAGVHDLQEHSQPHASHTGASWATVSRPFVRPFAIPITAGFAPSHEYVRRYWVAAIGAGAVEDLLRLSAAAKRGQAVPRPLFMQTLMTEGLAVFWRDQVGIPCPIPPLGSRAADRLSPSLASEHRRFIMQWPEGSGMTGWR